MYNSTDKPYIYLDTLSVRYGSKEILHNINMPIFKNKVTAIIGPSGCGKSTLLRCFNRMNDFVDGFSITGDINIDGKSVYNSQLNVQLLRTQVGMVFQKPNPFPKSIFDNVAYGLKLQRLSKCHIEEAVHESLEKVGLLAEVKERLRENALTLSGGQQQRLCIARAIAIRPTVLLMDEPCSALDPIATNAIDNLIISLKEKFTIIIVTHSMGQARKVSDFCVFLDKGHLLEYAPTKTLFANPNSDKIRSYISESTD